MHTALLLDMMADAAPDRLALGTLKDGLTFAEVRRRAHHGAEWLAFQGALPVALFAAGMLAKPFAPLNYRLPDADLRKLLARTAPSVAIVDDDMVARLGDTPEVTVVSRSAFEAACNGLGVSEASFDEDHDVAVLLFTSGTTGDPKAAILRHANLTSYVISTVEFMGSVIRIKANVAGSAVSMDTFNRTDTPPPAVGAQASIYINPQDFILLGT